MLTYREAKKYLSPGDPLFFPDVDGQIQRETVLRVHANSLSTTAGNVLFDDHGCIYFLPKRGCEDYLAGGMK